MNIIQAVARYGGKTVELNLDDTLYEAFKQLLNVTKEYADHEAEVWGRSQPSTQPDFHRDAIYSLEDVQIGFEHYDVYRNKPILIPGDAAIFLTRNRYMDTLANHEFMRSAAAKVLVTFLREELGIQYGDVVDGH